VNAVIWLADATWAAAVDAARTHVPADASITLLHVVDPAVAEAVRGAWAGLLGRGHTRDPGAEVDADTERAQAELLAAAAARLGRPARTMTRRGRLEREVVVACSGADLLIVARDGDLSRIGPHSLGPATRFVVDHAPCPVLLIWPERPAAALPPPPPDRPPRPPHHPPPHHRPPPPGQ
jgi:nucleotide-binding universal stress UspA family protein